MKKMIFRACLILLAVALAWAGGVKFARASANKAKPQEPSALTFASPVTYADAEGNTIVYYVLRTIYRNTEPPTVEGLDRHAIRTIFNPETAQTSEPLEIRGLPGMRCTLGERTYLCWTASAEYSFVLEYDAAVTPEQEILDMAESVDPNAA